MWIRVQNFIPEFNIYPSLIFPNESGRWELNVNRTTSAPNSVLRYDMDKGQNFVPEFNMIISQIVGMSSLWPKWWQGIFGKTSHICSMILKGGFSFFKNMGLCPYIIDTTKDWHKISPLHHLSQSFAVSLMYLCHKRSYPLFAELQLWIFPKCIWIIRFGN